MEAKVYPSLYHHNTEKLDEGSYCFELLRVYLLQLYFYQEPTIPVKNRKFNEGGILRGLREVGKDQKIVEVMKGKVSGSKHYGGRLLPCTH